VAAGCGRRGMPPPSCNNQTSEAVAVGSACSISDQFSSSQAFPFGRYFSLNINRRNELDLLTLKLVPLLRILVCLGLFCSRFMAQQVSGRSRDLVTLTFELMVLVGGGVLLFVSSVHVCWHVISALNVFQV